MKCWHCKEELIWGSDEDLDDSEVHDMVTYLSCPGCSSDVEVYLPKQQGRAGHSN